jgi:hypothetical protein
VSFIACVRARAIVIIAIIVIIGVVIEARTCRASTRALVLAIVAQPAVVAVHPYVARILSIPVAIFGANTRAAVLHHLRETNVSHPTSIRVVSNAAPGLSSIAFPVIGEERAPCCFSFSFRSYKVCRDLPFNWDPRSWTPCEGSRGKN